MKLPTLNWLMGFSTVTYFVYFDLLCDLFILQEQQQPRREFEFERYPIQGVLQNIKFGHRDKILSASQCYASRFVLGDCVNCDVTVGKNGKEERHRNTTLFFQSFIVDRGRGCKIPKFRAYLMGVAI